jgi:hypothetical protein
MHTEVSSFGKLHKFCSVCVDCYTCKQQVRLAVLVTLFVYVSENLAKLKTPQIMYLSAKHRVGTECIIFQEKWTDK